MQQELWPVNQPLINLTQSGSVILRQLDALPELRGQMRALDRLHIKVEHTVIRADSGVAGVGEGARLTVAEASDLKIEVSMLDSNCDGVRRMRQTLYSFLQKFWPLVVLFEVS